MKSLKPKKPCIFCKGFKLNKINFILIVLMCLMMYWINQYEIHRTDFQEKKHLTSLISTQAKP